MSDQILATDQELTQESTSEAVSGFKHFKLRECLLSSIEKLGYEKPSPIQEQTIPYILQGHDVLGQAETGSGKTAAFALPILSKIKIDKRHPQALILTPTRELAIQVADAVKKYGQDYDGLRVLPIYGGQSYDTQIRFLNRKASVVVGTPGRIMDLINKGALNLSELKYLVLDEADEMLNMGFLEDVEWIIDKTPENRQTILFSATMPPPIQKISKRYLKDPKEIKVKNKTATASTIEQKYMIVQRRQKLTALTQLLEVETFDGMIIFAKTKSMTNDLADILVNAGYRCMALNGEMQQSSREKTIIKFKSGAFDIIVATDIAARGLDVERVTHVINYDIPHNAMTYIHRIGRTGRAGREGIAITLISSVENRSLRMIEQTTKQKITKISLPSAQDIQKKRIDNFKETITENLKAKDHDFYKNIIKEYCEVHDVSELDACAVLAGLLHKKKSLAHIPEILKVEDRRDRRERDDRRGDRRDRRDRGDRRDRSRDGDRSFSRNDSDMERYCIKVGKMHGVMPGNIVGAIANEISINSKSIGQIKIHQKHSTVDLPKNLPSRALDVLSKVWVAGQQLHISKVG